MKHIQGDVMLRVANIPKEYRSAPAGGEVLALGEHSGHGHVTQACDIIIGADEKKYVIPKNSEQARLLHKHLKSNHPADHDPILLDMPITEEQCYEVVIQERYNPFTGLFEKVRD